MEPIKLIFFAAKDTDNFTLYKQTNGYSKLYLPKGLAQTLEAEIRPVAPVQKVS